MSAIIEKLTSILGAKNIITEPSDMDSYLNDWRGNLQENPDYSIANID